MLQAIGLGNVQNMLIKQIPRNPQ